MLIDGNIILEQGKLATSVYRIGTVSGLYTHLDGFVPSKFILNIAN